MKKIIGLVLITAVSTSLFISCKKEEEPTTIVGKWNATKEFYTEYKNGVLTSADTIIYGGDNKLMVEFTENGNGQVYHKDENNNFVTEDFTYKTEANNLILYISGDTINDSFTLTKTMLTIASSEENELNNDHYKWENKAFFTRQ